MYFLLLVVILYYTLVCCHIPVQNIEREYGRYEIYIRNGLDYDSEDEIDEIPYG